MIRLRYGWLLLLVGCKSPVGAEVLGHPCPSDEPSCARAVVAFLAVEERFAAFEPLVWRVAPRHYSEQLGDKLPEMQAVAREYEEVVALGYEPVSVAAHERIGELHQQLADSVAATPCVPRMKPAICERHRVELRTIAKPLWEGGIDHFNIAVALSRRLGVRNVWTDRAQLGLEACKAALATMSGQEK